MKWWLHWFWWRFTGMKPDSQICPSCQGRLRGNGPREGEVLYYWMTCRNCGWISDAYNDKQLVEDSVRQAHRLHGRTEGEGCT